MADSANDDDSFLMVEAAELSLHLASIGETEDARVVGRLVSRLTAAEADLAALRAERERLLRIEAAAREMLGADEAWRMTAEAGEDCGPVIGRCIDATIALRAALAPEGGTAPMRGTEQEAENG